jgi:threonylcarbamoyladenosine tRNA methylthiotransferase MtaB
MDTPRLFQPIQSIYLETLGCRLNEAETQAWADELQQRGYQLTTVCEDATIIIVNTCAVTNEAVRKSRQRLRRLRRANQHMYLVVTGCAVAIGAIHPEKIGIDLLISNAQKDQLVQLLLEQVHPKLFYQPILQPEVALTIRGRQRAFIKIQDGCRYQCSFCITTIARGSERSRQPQEIIDQIQTLSAAGIHEVVLTGVQLGGYGRDINTRLLTLLIDLLRKTTIPQIRLGSLEPWKLPSALWRLWGREPRLAPHVHLPLQSGSDSVLKRMARRCTTATFSQIVTEARARVPHLNISTDLIVGFPGETETEWQQTLDYVTALQFSQIHIFPYSPRPGTSAAQQPDQVSPEIRAQRCAQLQAIAKQARLAALEREIGHIHTILIEGRHVQSQQNQAWFGYTPNYLPVKMMAASANHSLQNQLITVMIVGIDRVHLQLIGLETTGIS